jgi:hypothetical protein
MFVIRERRYAHPVLLLNNCAFVGHKNKKIRTVVLTVPPTSTFGSLRLTTGCLTLRLNPDIAPVYLHVSQFCFSSRNHKKLDNCPQEVKYKWNTSHIIVIYSVNKHNIYWQSILKIRRHVSAQWAIIRPNAKHSTGTFSECTHYGIPYCLQNYIDIEIHKWMPATVQSLRTLHVNNQQLTSNWSITWSFRLTHRLFMANCADWLDYRIRKLLDCSGDWLSACCQWRNDQCRMSPREF